MRANENPEAADLRTIPGYGRRFGTTRTRVERLIIMHSSITLDDIDVVIVEDDEDVRFSLAGFLSRQGARVFPCSNAGEALEAVRVHHPNIVLSDIGLPDRDGLQLLQDIRSLDATRDRSVPVIAMTAFGWSGQHAQKLWSAFQAHLDKPFKPDQLLSVVASTLNIRHSPAPEHSSAAQ